MSEILKLDITDLTTQGLGIARRPDGKVVMVKNALPGESVTARLLDERKGFALARMEQLLLVSPQRVQPPCPWFGQCGGCDLQHLSYPAQVRAKLAWLEQSLRAQQPLPEIILHTSPMPLGYRHRLRLHCRQCELGFFARQSHELVPVGDCLLAVSRIREQWSALSRLAALPGLREVEFLGGEQQVYACLLGSGLQRRSLEIAGLDLHWPGQPLDSGITCYEQDGVKLKAWPGQFSQVNWEVNHKLIACLLDLAEPYLNGVVYDLFAGSGNLSLPLARAGANVWAVEGNTQACAAGTYQAEINKLACNFIHAPVERFLRQPAATRPGLLVLDPPRNGLSNLLGSIISLKARAICYVSCHPAAMSRDIKTLAQAGYCLEKLALLDMFPQTGQMECLALLVK